MHEEQVGAGLRKRLHHFHEVGPVRRLAAGEIDPLEERIGRREGLHLGKGKFVIEAARRVLDLPDVAVNTAGVAALGDDENKLGGLGLDPRGRGGRAQTEPAPGIEGGAHLAGTGGSAGANCSCASLRRTSRSVCGRATGAFPPKRA